MTKANVTVATYDGLSYVDIPSMIGRLKAKGFKFDNIIKRKSVLYPGKYIIEAYM